MENAKKPHNQRSDGNLLIGALISGGIGLGVILGLTLLLPLIFIGGNDPDAMVLPMAIISVALGGFTGGFISARREKGEELLSAAITSLMMVAPMVLISFLYKKGFDFGGFAIIAITLVASALSGAVLVSKAGGNKKRSLKKIMKKRRT